VADQQQTKYRQYEKAILDFVAKDNGLFFAISHDQTFLKMYRQTLNKELVIGTDRIRTLPEEHKFLSEIKTPYYKDKRILLLIERVLNNRSTLSFVRNLKAMHDDMYIVVLTSEVERQVLILLHEIGVGNFITKPVSMNTLIEKLAFTIKPQGKIGQFIDTAKSYLAKGMNEEVITLADKILKLKPGSAAALMVRGDAFKGKGDVSAAEQSYMEAHKGAALYLEPLKKLAELHRDGGDLEKQLKYLIKLDRLSPLNVERKINMGEIHMEFGNSELAEEFFDQAVVNAKKEAQSLIEEVKRSIAEKCLDKAPATAERYFRSILDSRGGQFRKVDIETFNRLGIALRRQGRWQDAVSEYGLALKISPDDENLHFNTAVAYTEGGKHREAVQVLEKVLKIQPEFGADSSVLSFNIGVMYANARKNDLALQYMKRTLSLDPSHQGAKKLAAAL